jgi:phospholipid/cholesterol/gamma-HCH transport system substrate-binding protein
MGSRRLFCGGFIMSIEAKVGVFVIVSLLVLGGTVYRVRSAQDVRGQVAYTTRLSYAGGVADGTPVLFGGIRVGQVASVRPSPADPTRIEIAFAVKAGTPVNAESIARVGSVTLMSSPVLFLTNGSNKARRLQAGEEVASRESIGPDEIAARLASVADSAGALLANLTEISGPKNQQHIEHVLAELETTLRRESPKIARITDRMTALAGHADDLVVSAKPVVGNLDHAITSVSTTVDAVRDPLMGDLAQLQRTLESAQAVLDGAQHLVSDNEGDVQQIVRSLRAASENARLLTETLKERPWNLIRTSQPGDRKVPR